MNECYKCKSPHTVGQVHLASSQNVEACKSCRDAFHDGMNRGSFAEYYRIKAALEAAGVAEARVVSIIGRP